MKRIERLSLITAICIITVLTGCTKEEAKTDALAQKPPLEEHLIVYGDVKADKSQELIIDFPAKVQEVYIKDGETVNKGDQLLTLDIEDYKLEIQTKENEIKMLEIQLDKLGTNSNPQTPDIARLKEELSIKQNYASTGNDPDLIPLQNSLEVIEKSIAISQKDYESNKALFEKGYITEKALKQSEQLYKNDLKEKKNTLTAIAKVKTNRSIEIDSLNTQLKSTMMEVSNSDKQKISNIDELKLKIETAKLELDAMKNKLSKPYIKDNHIIAPEDALIIYDINCTQGTQITDELGPILKAMYKDTLMVTADIPEESITSVHVGDQASIIPADDQGDTLSGTITRISHRAVEKDGDVYVEAVVEVKEGKELLKPGMTVDIKIIP